MQVEQINPYTDDSRHKTEQVREMFDSIAPAYDFMNRAMTFGIDRLWRRRAVKMMRDVAHSDVLDIATGTGDLAIMMAKTMTDAKITGLDLSEADLTTESRSRPATASHSRLPTIRLTA